MARKGLLIEYEYCNGCMSCVVACKQEHQYPVGKGGIQLSEVVTELPGSKLRMDFVPFVTAYCDLCAKRVKDGERPACVKACQAATMFYGTVTQMAKLMEDKPRSCLYAPR
ncbi:MAG: hypothetical protein A3I01_08475 [Betaproteobacteria bacterium RIFCSPLOWO2_02_FULL_65_24]|nr:MAG: hypothetical protein A3I01_08475 [Betaproteobacteria bacterium RIFCSPLOWO2_02_FULL_65_24]OGA35612.1 MAG: hypothetical protein A3G80_03125 [Betaproteobacteria bacterium RIFCSPLOWO2_12_FULL_62_13b]